MSYSIADLLEGKLYRSRSFKRRGLEGIIQWAEKRDNVYVSGGEAYLVKVRPQYKGEGFPKPDFYATVYVALGDN